MFKFFKKKELEIIEYLKEELSKEQKRVKDLRDEVLVLSSKLGTAIQIGNKKRVVKCSCKDCMDWEDGTCSLDKIDIRPDKDHAYCMDFDSGSVMEEFDKPFKPALTLFSWDKE